MVPYGEARSVLELDWIGIQHLCGSFSLSRGMISDVSKDMGA